MVLLIQLKFPLVLLVVILLLFGLVKMELMTSK
jgi:hypothetical protein